jgi:hypothetical protein
VLRLCRGSVAPHLVRGCCRCLRRRRRHRRCDRSLARCGCSRRGFAGTRNQHQGKNAKRRTKYNCSFHSMNGLFKRQFVTNSVARRIRTKNSSFWVEREPDRRIKPYEICFGNLNLARSSLAASLARHVSVLIPEFSVSARLASATFCVALFRAS